MQPRLLQVTFFSYNLLQSSCSAAARSRYNFVILSNQAHPLIRKQAQPKFNNLILPFAESNNGNQIHFTQLNLPGDHREIKVL